jgi:hypothetical protein
MAGPVCVWPRAGSRANRLLAHHIGGISPAEFFAAAPLGNADNCLHSTSFVPHYVSSLC